MSIILNDVKLELSSGKVSMAALRTLASETPGAALAALFGKCGGGSIEQVDYPKTHLTVTDAPAIVIDANPRSSLPFIKKAFRLSLKPEYDHAAQAIVAFEPQALGQLQTALAKAAEVSKPVFLVGAKGTVQVSR